VDVSDNTTVILGETAEPQPDLLMRVFPEFGGQSKTSIDDYVQGAPELVAEVALSSRSIDLHLKRKDYTEYGVLEYMVVCLREKQLRWFDLRADQELTLDSDSVCRTKTFPGFWIDSTAFFASDYAAVMATLRKGMSVPQHADFVARLAAARDAKR
jgi:Uma2 family endonuclease